MKKMFISILDWLIPLPPVEKRKQGIIPYCFIHRNLHPEYNIHYLCYKLFNTLFFIGLCVMVVLLLDIKLETYLLVDKVRYIESKLYFSFLMSIIMSFITFLLSITYYFRVRITLNLRKSYLFFGTVRASMLSGVNNEQWGKVHRLQFWMSVFVIPGSYLGVSQFIYYRNSYDSLIEVLIFQVLALVAVSFGGVYVVNSLIINKKAKLYFPEALKDLEQYKHEEEIRKQKKG